MFMLMLPSTAADAIGCSIGRDRKQSGPAHTSLCDRQSPEALQDNIGIDGADENFRRLGHLVAAHELCTRDGDGVPVHGGHCTNLIVLGVVRDEVHAADVSLDDHAIKRVGSVADKSQVFAVQAGPEERHSGEGHELPEHVLGRHSALLSGDVPMLYPDASAGLHARVRADITGREEVRRGLDVEQRADAEGAVLVQGHALDKPRIRKDAGTDDNGITWQDLAVFQLDAVHLVDASEEPHLGGAIPLDALLLEQPREGGADLLAQHTLEWHGLHRDNRHLAAFLLQR
mmetsp:Transcript_26357/g.87352  ORF Transcript_26357/g.87352 Transcript_26357/m.87352 type:complete len:287 (-) Transcript_26357:1245-2105(-)